MKGVDLFVKILVFGQDFVSMEERRKEGGRILILRSATQAHRTKKLIYFFRLSLRMLTIQYAVLDFFLICYLNTLN